MSLSFGSVNNDSGFLGHVVQKGQVDHFSFFQRCMPQDRTFVRSYEETDVGHVKPRKLRVEADVVARLQVTDHFFVDEFAGDIRNGTPDRGQTGKVGRAIALCIQVLFNADRVGGYPRRQIVRQGVVFIVRPVAEEMPAVQKTNGAVFITGLDQVLLEIGF